MEAPAVPVPDTEGCFEVKRVKMNILLDPQYLGDISIGVREKLNRCLMRYSPQLGGVPINVVSASLEQSSGAIVGDAPGVQCSVFAKYLVFAPRPGQLLLGDVNAVSVDHIGMLIYDNWNASIPRADIPEQYEYDAERERWCDRDFDFPVIETGSSVSFTFTAFERDADGAFSVVGSLSTPHTGLVRKKGDASAKRKREREVDDAAESNGVADRHKSKKNKKNKAKSANLDDGSHPRGATSASTYGMTAGAAVEADEMSHGDSVKKKNKKKKENNQLVLEHKTVSGNSIAPLSSSADTTVESENKAKKKKKKRSKEHGVGSSSL